MSRWFGWLPLVSPAVPMCTRGGHAPSLSTVPARVPESLLPKTQVSRALFAAFCSVASCSVIDTTCACTSRIPMAYPIACCRGHASTIVLKEATIETVLRSFSRARERWVLATILSADGCKCEHAATSSIRQIMRSEAAHRPYTRVKSRLSNCMYCLHALNPIGIRASLPASRLP